MTAPPISDTAAWAAWLAAVRAAADDLQDRLDGGRDVVFADLPPQPTAGGPPEAVRAAAQPLLELLELLERRVEARRDHVRAQLRGLAVPRPTGTNHDLGSRLDVAG
jgi:hypothetical protein